MSIATRYEKMTPREQRLLLIFGAVCGAMLVLGIPAYLYSTVASARDLNGDIRTQLRKMDQAGPLLAQRRDAREAREALYAKPQLPLASFIENAARAQEIEVPESSDQPDVFLKGFVEHSTQVKFRKVGLKALVQALEQIEHSGLPIAITSLHISARSQPDEYDVTLTVSQFAKKADDGKGDKPDAKKKGQTL